MTLTPEDIERKVFKQEFRGYDQEEVDTFLDRIVDRMVELIRECDLLTARVQEAERQTHERVAQVEAYAQERIAEVETRASEAIQNERLLKRALLTAERVADQTLTEANAQAEEILARASTEAERILDEARREAEELIGDARHEAAQTLAEAKEYAGRVEESYRCEFDRIQRTVTEFNQLRDEYRDRVRAILNEHLARFDQAGDLPETPASLIDLAKVSRPDFPRLPDWEPEGGQGAYAGVEAGNGGLGGPVSE
jgi:DivIVA domain-containing protein